MSKDSDDDDKFEEEYFSYKIKKYKSFFTRNSQDNLIRCEDCFLLSYIRSIKYKNNSILIYSSCRNNHEKKYDLIEYLNKFKENKMENVLCKYDDNKFDIDIFIYCLECRLYFCQNCQKHHDKNGNNFNHHLIKAKFMDFYCFEHIKPFKYFCCTCEKNICLDCEGHNEHNIVDFKDYKIDNINEYIIKFEQNELYLNKIENYLVKKSSNIKNYFNVYKSKILYLNDLLKNILLTYQFEKNSNSMNFELLYNLIFVTNNNKALTYNQNKLDLIKSKKDFEKYNLDLNNYPLILNDQQIISKNFLFSKSKIGFVIDHSSDSDKESEISRIPSNKKNLNEIKLSSKVFNMIEKIIAIGAEKMNSKFCFTCYSRYFSKKKYIIYNDINHFLYIYSIEKRKNLRILKNLNIPDEDVYENVKSIKVFDDIVNNEKIVLFSTNQKSINKLKIYELKKYSIQNIFIFDKPLNDFCFYNLNQESFIALNEQGKRQIDIFYKDGRKFKQLNFIENVICMECCEDIVKLKPKIYLLVTGNNYLKSFDMNNYRLHQNYNKDNKDFYIFSKFYKTKDKFQIITSLINGDLKLIDFNNPNSYEIFNPDKNKFPIICFNFLNASYLFAATEDKKIKIYDLNEKKIINTYYYNNNITSLEIMPNVENSYLYIYDEEGNVIEYSINQF